MAKDITIKYTNKDFNNLRGSLVELARNYFPDSFNDFTPTSPGMMFVEMAAYVGDILSFYQDSQLQETYLQYAQDPANLYTLAYMMGYRPKVTTPSSVDIQITQRVQATGSSFLPDYDQALNISTNVQLETGNQKFIIEEPIDFKFSSSLDPTGVEIYSLSGDDPSEYLLTKTVTATSGEIVTKTVNVGGLTKFFTFDINDTNIIKILDITDSSNNEWYEVPYLGQATVLERGSLVSAGGIKSNLAVESKPRRFVSRFKSSGVLQVQFGPGDSSVSSSTFLPDPTLVGNSISGQSRLNHAYDPSNFTFSDSYGVAPANTTLTVRYLKGGGVSSNVAANTLTTATGVTATANDNTYAGTLQFNNPKAATGGRDGDTVEELRQNSLRSFNAQGRLVTREDFAFRALTMDAEFGVVSKAYVTTDEAISMARSNTPDPLKVCLYVLSYDVQKKLVNASNAIKENLKKYLSEFMMITDSVDIKDAFVINIGVNFDIITLPNYNSRDVLLECTNALKSHFAIEKWDINQSINLSTLFTLLDRVKGVQTVQSIKLLTKTGNGYSEFDYDIEGATKENIVYPSLDPMIFEVKFPNTDIQGRITTL
tara:strand:+ start:1976 stop:3766 length:1791 start_codon:yes stop_codon:yes gene_type:complete